MESPEGAKYELLVIVATFVIAGVLTYVTHKQRQRAAKLKIERKKFAKELAELQKRFK